MIENKVALITGSGKRLGAGIIKTLHSSGWNVVIHCNKSGKAAEQLKNQLEAERADSVLLIKANLLEFDKFSQVFDGVFEKWQRLDLLINNASNFYPTRIGDITDADWKNLIDVNLKVPLFLSQLTSKYLEATHGSIINIADIHGERPLKEYTVYSISKAGIIMLTKSLARELGPDIRVNAIAPGAILWPENAMDDKTKSRILKATALKRVGSIDDIAKAALYLAEEATYTTGQILVVDGGRTLSN